MSLEEAERRGISATRQLAKRQLTWMRSETLAASGSIRTEQVPRRRGIATCVSELRELGL